MQNASDSKTIDVAWWVSRLQRDTKSNDVICTAGYGSGKTLGAWQWLISKMQRNPRCKIHGFTEPTYGLIQKVAIPKFREYAELIGAKEDRDYTVNTGTEPKIKIKKTKQEILLLSMDRPESIIGYELGAAVSDESAFNKEESDKNLTSRMRAKNIDLNQTLKITTPEGINYFAERYDSETLPGWKMIDQYDHFKSEKVKILNRSQVLTTRRFRVTTYHNQHNLPFDYIPNLYKIHGHNQNYIDSYVFGHFRPFTTGLAYNEYKGVLHKTDEYKPTPELPLILTWDFNIRPQWVTIQERMSFDPLTRAREYKDVILDNANFGGENLLEALAEFAAKHPPDLYQNTPIHLYGDSTGHHGSHKSTQAGDTDFKFIKRNLHKLGYKQVAILAFEPPNPLERSSVDAVNMRFAKGALLVSDRCDMVLKSLSRTTWAGKARAKLDKPKNDTWTHPTDAVKYYIWAKYSYVKVFA